MPESITIIQFLFLAVAAFFAGFVDAIAGGGGLISLPSLLAVGIPPHIALATNKVQSDLHTPLRISIFFWSRHAGIRNESAVR